jgi:hypothetical protein
LIGLILLATKVWQKTGGLNAASAFVFCSALLSARLYKFGDINNNELLIINLVPHVRDSRLDEFQIPVIHQGLER